MTEILSTVLTFGTQAGVDIVNKMRGDIDDIVQALIDTGDKVTNEMIQKSDEAVAKITAVAETSMLADAEARIPVLMIEVGRSRMLHIVTNQEGCYLALNNPDMPSYLRTIGGNHGAAILGTLLANVVLATSSLDEIPVAAIAFNDTMKKGHQRLVAAVEQAAACPVSLETDITMN